MTITPAQVDNSSSDNCDSDLTLAINIANYNCSHVGQTNYVLLSATDDAGNTSYAFSTVTVLDATPPTISLNGANPVTVELFSSYTELGATASDTCDDSLPSVTIDNSSVDTNTVGSYTVTYNLDDASRKFCNSGYKNSQRYRYDSTFCFHSWRCCLLPEEQ